jgi:hypothetical protein
LSLVVLSDLRPKSHRISVSNAFLYAYYFVFVFEVVTAVVAAARLVAVPSIGKALAVHLHAPGLGALASQCLDRACLLPDHGESGIRVDGCLLGHRLFAQTACSAEVR